MQEDLFVWPPKECRRELAAANLQTESYLEAGTTRDGRRLASRTQHFISLRQSAVPNTSCLIIPTWRSAESTAIWLGAFRSASKSWKANCLSDATAAAFHR